jgi:hypothetical protein
VIGGRGGFLWLAILSMHRAHKVTSYRENCIGKLIPKTLKQILIKFGTEKENVCVKSAWKI